MRSLAPNETVVKEGTFLYDGEIECDIRIIRSPVRYGSGDHEDPPEVENDLEQSAFYIQYGSTTERGVFNAGGGGYPTLAEAVLLRWLHQESGTQSVGGRAPMLRPNPSIEGTSTIRLRLLAAAPHVKR